KNRVTEEAKSPDPEANQGFIQSRYVFDNFSQGTGNESWDDESHPLLDPDAHNGQGTSHIQPPQAPADRQDKQHQSQHIQSYGGPYPGTQGMMAMQPEIKIFRRGDVEVAGIELFEQFVEQQKHIDQHRDLNNSPQGQQGPIRDAIVGD